MAIDAYFLYVGLAGLGIYLLPTLIAWAGHDAQLGRRRGVELLFGWFVQVGPPR